MSQVFIITSYGPTMIWTPIVKFKWKKLSPCNSCMLGEKQKNINDFRWINVGIAFGRPFVVEVTLGDGGISLCNTCILKLYHAPREAFGEGIQYNCMQVLQYIFYVVHSKVGTYNCRYHHTHNPIR
jgi:hypothetical protein